MEKNEVEYKTMACPYCETEQLDCRRTCTNCGRTLTKEVQRERIVDGFNYR